VIGLTRSAALDYAAKGIRINAVCPGMVDTPMAAFVTKNYDPQIVRRMVTQEPIGRFGEPEEIAAAVVCCAAQPRASWWVMPWRSMAASSPANRHRDTRIALDHGFILHGFLKETLMNLFEVAQEITKRLTRIFLRDESRRRPVFGGAEKFQCDPNWRDNLLFYEYFHGDNGAGIGASHQTGWTGVIAGLIDIFGKLDAETFLQGGRGAVFGREIETA
jgi:Enoyl-(Acyl carrier protein) reductase